MERTPGRNWINTGYGANVQSVDFGSPSGGRGKPVKMYVQPFSSPPVIGMRSGAYNGGYPMCIVYPQVSGHEASIRSCIYRVFLSLCDKSTLDENLHLHPQIIGKRLLCIELSAVVPGPVSGCRVVMRSTAGESRHAGT